MKNESHSTTMGYLLWILGFTGAHRFYYGRPWTGTLWFLTGGLFLVGWIIDFFLIPQMDREADLRFTAGPFNYNVAWCLLTFLGYLGAHRFYLRKWGTAFLYLFTGGIFTLGYLYDLWHLNEIVSRKNKAADSLQI